MKITSASGFISLLNENGQELQEFALHRLNDLVDKFWPEISEAIVKIESLCEDKSFRNRNLAALLASKIYYHLGSFDDCLTYAISANHLFDINQQSEYVDTIISKCMDQYAKLRLQNLSKTSSPAATCHPTALKSSGEEKVGHIPEKVAIENHDHDDGLNEEQMLDDGQNQLVEIDPRLEDIVNRMFERCFVQQQYKQVLGLALETRRMDVFERSIVESNDVVGMLNHAFKVCMSLLENRQFRDEILRILVRLYRNLEKPDYINMIQCLIFLDDAESVGSILHKLTINSASNDDDYLIAYQIAFDLYESGTQQFLLRVIQSIQSYAPIPSLISTLTSGSSSDSTQAENAPENSASVSGSTTENGKPEAGESSPATTKDSQNLSTATGAVEEMDVDSNDAADDANEESGSVKGGKKRRTVTPTTSNQQVNKTLESLSEQERKRQEHLMKLSVILNGETTIELQLQFMIRKNHADLLILKQTKDCVRNTICHSATVIANGLMHYGTTSDVFLRDNLEWLGRAVNWAKFTATASLGVIHHGHEKDGLHLLAPYLPKTSGSGAGSASAGAGYTEGGALYALGLIYANHGLSISDYLLQQLRDASNEAIKHGACLGLGLAAMGTNRCDIYDQLKFNLYQDDAITGEAAGIAMGLVMLGSNSLSAITDMLSYAQETQHEKILRGISIGIGLMMFGCMEQADEMIASLESNKDALLRRAAMHAISLAYCGSGNNRAIAKLLHVAVSDVNDDVRRAAVCGIGFILFRNPEQCPNVVSLLSESYNPHVRCGAAMAIGICCAGSGSKEAIAILEPMINDPVNFVRQGALIASSLVLIQQTDVLNPKVKDFRQLYAKVIADKHDDVMAKFGAILAQGIIDAGARNVTVSLQSRTGHTNVRAVVGMLVFTQFWYWYPLTHFLSLAFTPTFIVGLNSNMKIPKLQIRSNAKPSTFAYPPPVEEKKEREREKVSTAILSITAKAKKKEASKASKNAAATSSNNEMMEVDHEDSSAGSKKTVAAGLSVAKSSSNSSQKPVAKDAKEKDSKDGVKNSKDVKEKEGKEKDGKDKEKELKEGKEKEKKKDEPSFEMLTNPARVLRQQLKVIQMPEGSRYVPMKDISIGGIVIMKDTRPDEPEELVEPVIAHGSKGGEEKEPEPPEPFEYTED